MKKRESERIPNADVVGTNIEETEDVQIEFLTEPYEKEKEDCLDIFTNGNFFSDEFGSLLHFSNKEKLARDPDVVRAGKEALFDAIKKSKFGSIDEILQFFSWGEDVLDDPDIFRIVIVMLEDYLRRQYDHVFALLEEFHNSKRIVNHPRIKEVVRTEFLSVLFSERYSFEEIKHKLEILNIGPDELSPIVAQKIEESFLSEDIYFAGNLIKYFTPLHQSVLGTARKALVKYITEEEINQISYFKDYVPLFPDLSREREVLDLAKRKHRDLLLHDYFEDAFVLADLFGLANELQSDPGVLEAAKIKFAEYVNYGNAEYAEKVKKAFELKHDFVQPAVVKGIHNLLLNGELEDIEAVADLIEKLSVSNYLTEEVSQTISDLDQKKSKDLNKSDILYFVHMLAKENIGKVFPKIYDEARKMVFVNLDWETELQGLFVDNLHNFRNLPASVAYDLCQAGYLDQVLKYRENFIDPNDTDLLEGVLASGDYRKATQFHLTLESPNKDLLLTQEVFGDHATTQAYEMIKGIREGNVDQQLKSFGVSRAGEAGINQLKERLNQFKSEILNLSFDPKILLEFDFLKQYFMSYTRYGSSEWGTHSSYVFDSTIKNYLKVRGSKNYKFLDPEYMESGEINVNRVDEEQRKSFQYSEQFLSRYDSILNSLKNTLALMGERKPLSTLAVEAEEKKQRLTERLQQKLASQDNPKARERLQLQLSRLQQINARDLKDFQKNFSFFSEFKEFHDLLSQTVFYIALHKHRNHRDIVRNLVDKDKPDFDDISATVGFLEHIVNEETWKEYFTDRHAKKSFESIINSAALQEELSRAQGQKVKGTTKLEFIPTRGLLMEFSGDIGDACWASTYESMAKEFPNFFSVIMVQNRGTKHERLAGASMMIETNAEDGTPLLVIRGLNPLENIINSLSVKDFVAKFTAYAREMAEKTNRKLAIVIDGHVGGSGTNRPALYNFLSKQSESLQRVKLKSAKDTTFNGYNIVDNVYLI